MDAGKLMEMASTLNRTLNKLEEDGLSGKYILPLIRIEYPQGKDGGYSALSSIQVNWEDLQDLADSLAGVAEREELTYESETDGTTYEHTTLSFEVEGRRTRFVACRPVSS